MWGKEDSQRYYRDGRSCQRLLFRNEVEIRIQRQAGSVQAFDCSRPVESLSPLSLHGSEISTTTISSPVCLSFESSNHSQARLFRTREKSCFSRMSLMLQRDSPSNIGIIRLERFIPLTAYYRSIPVIPQPIRSGRVRSPPKFSLSRASSFLTENSRCDLSCKFPLVSQISLLRIRQP